MIKSFYKLYVFERTLLLMHYYIIYNEYKRGHLKLLDDTYFPLWSHPWLHRCPRVVLSWIICSLFPSKRWLYLESWFIIIVRSFLMRSWYRYDKSWGMSFGWPNRWGVNQRFVIYHLKDQIKMKHKKKLTQLNQTLNFCLQRIFWHS